MSGTASESVTQERPVRVLIGLLFALTVVPGFLLKAAGGGRQQLVDQQSSVPPIVSQVQLVLGILVVATCVVLALRRARQWPTNRGGLTLGVAISLWVYFVLVDMIHGYTPALLSFMFPAVVVAIWAAQPSLQSLTSVAYCGAFTALLSIAMGVFAPAAGLYANSDGNFVSADKGVLPGQLLSGVFTSTNNLGQFLVLCLPAALLVRPRSYSIVLMAVFGVAIFWSGSRSSMAAAAVVLVFALMLRKTAISRRLVGSLAFVSATVCVVVPFVASGAASALSGRGNLWRVSIAAWEGSPVIGLGSRWYLEIARMRSDFGSRSIFLVFHAHNQILHILVTGGVLAVAVFGLFVYLIWRSIISTLSSRGIVVASAILVCFFVSGSLELNLGVVDRFQFYATALVPLLVLGFGHESPNIEGNEVAQLGKLRSSWRGRSFGG